MKIISISDGEPIQQLNLAMPKWRVVITCEPRWTDAILDELFEDLHQRSTSAMRLPKRPSAAN